MKLKEKQLEGSSLLIFSSKSRTRGFFNMVAYSKKFDYTILFFIFVSSVLLAIESPLEDPNS